MDVNVVVLAGHLAAEPEYRTFASGSSMVRLLVTTRTTGPRRRVDVIPVSWWEPPAEPFDEPLGKGSRVWVVGALQRRFWTGDRARSSRIEVVALEVSSRPELDDGRSAA